MRDRVAFPSTHDRFKGGREVTRKLDLRNPESASFVQPAAIPSTVPNGQPAHFTARRCPDKSGLNHCPERLQ